MQPGCRRRLLGVITTSGFRQTRMKHLCGRGGLDDLDVVFGAERQKPLQTGAGVLGALPLEAVWQEHHQAREPIPLIFGADDELVDHDLRSVDEVAKLGLPGHETVGAVKAVAILEAEHACLGERAVVDLHGRLIGAEVLQ